MRKARFVDEDRFEGRLLRAASEDAPPREAMARAEAALGIGIGIGATMAATATATAKAASAQAGAGHVATHLGIVSIAKWVGVGLVSGAVVTGGLRFGADADLRARAVRRFATNSNSPSPNHARVQHTTTHVTPAPRLDAPPPEALPVAPSLEPPRPAVRAEARATPAPAHVAEAPLRRVPDPVVAPAEANAPVASLADELAILARARHAAVAQQPDAVLRELDTYARTPSARLLQAEANMLAIEALLARGDTRAAQARAMRALADAPDGQHAARLREIIARTGP
jgi:hypothetical protein